MSTETTRTTRMVCIFLLGILLLNYPLLSLFDLPHLILGIPMQYGYIFLVWGVLIILVGLTTGSVKPPDRRSDSRDRV